MHRDHLTRSALVGLLVAIAAAVALWPAAARADDITVFEATAGVPFGGVVATIHKDCGGSNCVIFNPFVTVTWGDGAQTMGVKGILSCDPDPNPNPNNLHCVSGDYSFLARDSPHTYARPGAYAVSFSGPFFSTVNVDGIVGDDPHSIAETVPALTPVVGATVSGAIATFTDTNPLVQASEFTATINWGDGVTTPATVTQPLGQPFSVSGTHVYAKVGSFPVTVAIQHSGINPTPNVASASITTTATVRDATLTGAGNPLTAVAGVPFSGTVAGFSDPNPFATAADFHATITWGPEGSTPGSVTAVPGGFAVAGSHTFSGSGEIPVSVAVSSSGGSRVTVGTTASVSAAPPAPVTTVALSPAAPDGKRGWYRSAVHATVSARSVAGTVAETRCRLDGTAPTAFGGLPSACPFAGAGSDIAADGRHLLFAASITSGGQAEVPAATSVAIDHTAPRLACARTAPSFVQGSTGATVSASVSDATSGPLSRTVSAPASVESPGRKQARLTGFDQAGNSASIRCAYRVLGHINPSMFWNFNPGRSFTTVVTLAGDDVPVAATVRMRCRGTGCPAARTIKVSARRAPTGTVNLVPLFRGHQLGLATVVTVTMSERNAIGKAWAFTVRSGRNPKIVISCLAPGSKVPGRGC